MYTAQQQPQQQQTTAQVFGQVPLQQQQQSPDKQSLGTVSEALVHGIDLDALDHDFVLQDKSPEMAASIFQQYANAPIRTAFVGAASVRNDKKNANATFSSLFAFVLLIQGKLYHSNYNHRIS